MVVIGTVLAPMDTSVNVAFPHITGAFAKPMAAIQWVIICYVLTYASLMLVCGKLGDLFGYRLIFVTGLLVSFVGLAACALAGTFELLLAARIVQGIGTALVLSCSAALALALFPAEQRTRILGVYTMAFGIGMALAPAAAGLMIQHWGWPTVFWGRLPLCAAALVLAFMLPRSVRQESKGGFDFLGGILITAALTAAIFALNRSQADDGTLMAALLGIVAVTAFILFIMQENRAPEPIIRPQLFRDLAFSVVNLASVTTHLVGFSVMLLVPYYLDIASVYTALLAGLTLALNPVGYVIGSILGPTLIGRLSGSRVCLVGLSITTIGLFMIGRWQAEMNWLSLAPSLLLIGFGQGTFQVSYIDTVMARLPVSEHGVAGSLGNLTRTIGVVFGASVLTLIFSQLRAGQTDDLAGFMTAFSGTFTL